MSSNIVVAGIDLGTAAIKLVLINGQEQLLWSKTVPALPENIKKIENYLEEGVKMLSITRDDISGMAVTGYGKRILPFANKAVDEITAIGTGAYYLSDKLARTIINIGGQDIKVISVSADGTVVDFKMNNKCAAGTGRFLENAAKILNLPVSKLGDFTKTNQKGIDITTTCAVFIETEIVSLLYKNTDKADIIFGLYRTIAKKIMELISGIKIDQVVYLDGGPANNKNLLAVLEEELMINIKKLQHPQLTGALGAALTLMKEK